LAGLRPWLRITAFVLFTYAVGSGLAYLTVKSYLVFLFGSMFGLIWFVVLARGVRTARRSTTGPRWAPHERRWPRTTHCVVSKPSDFFRCV